MPLWSDFLTNRERSVHKWMHYFPAYERHFARFVNTDVVMIEIGSGDGGSAQMWKRYFGPHARIYSLDIRPAVANYAEDQIEFRIGDQGDVEFLARVIKETGPPDVILDDGSHKMQHMLASFEFLYPLVSKNGVYAIEDMHTCYWPAYGGGLRAPESFMEHCKTLIDELNADFTKGALAPNAFTRSTLSMHFYDSMVFFEKGRPLKKTSRKIGNNDLAKPPS